MPHTAEGRGPVTRPRSLDRVDRAIIEALQENGRDSFRGIAAKIGVAEATVRSRYARLVDDDILRDPAQRPDLRCGHPAFGQV